MAAPLKRSRPRDDRSVKHDADKDSRIWWKWKCFEVFGLELNWRKQNPSFRLFLNLLRKNSEQSHYGTIWTVQNSWAVSFQSLSCVIIRAVIVQHGFSGLIFVWGNGHKKVALGAGRKRRGVDGRGGRHGGLHGELPGLSLPDTPPPLASTVNCRKCSVKPALNQNTMIRLLPIIHSWKSPETGNVSSLTGLCWGGYKRGLSEQGAGLFLARGWFILTAPMNSGD